MMTDFSEYLDTVVASIATTLSADLTACKSLAGLLETTDIAVIHQETPAVFVAMAGTGDMVLLETEEHDVTMKMVAYALIVHADSQQREILVRRVTLRLLAHIDGQRWGLSYAHPATAVESADLHGLAKGFKSDTSTWRTGVSVFSLATDLYGADDPIKSLALWAVTWEQKLRIGTNIFTAGGSVPIPSNVSSTIQEETSQIIAP